MVSLQTVKTIVFTIGPFVAPYIYRKFKALKHDADTNKLAVRPAPPHVRKALNILFVACVLAVISTLPFLAPENVFTFTSSRLQTPSNVLWERMTNLRPDRTLTELDEKLRNSLLSVDGRCLYLFYGPDIVGHCPFCRSDEPNSYFYYALPSILFPHLLNLIALGLATSRSIAKKDGGRWRVQATVAGLVLAVADVAVYQTWDWKANARVHRPEELVHFYWVMRFVRGIALTVLDGGFALLLWLSSTNRLFVLQPTATERLQMVTRLLEITGGKLAATSMVQNATARSENTRQTHDAYWRREGELMDQVMAEKPVVDSVRDALSSGRVNMDRINSEARSYGENLIAAQEHEGS